MNTGRLFIFSALFPFLITACQQPKTAEQDPNLLPASVINNPQSLDEKSAEANKQVPVMTFTEQEHKFGQIQEGDTVYYEFKFSNTGNGNLVISTATASCGCTVPYYPKKPIPPGGEETIKVTFSNKNVTKGVFRKEINILANTVPSENKIYITGEVL